MALCFALLFEGYQYRGNVFSIEGIMEKNKRVGNYSTDIPCTVRGCMTENGNTFHHIKSRGSGGTDDAWNKLPVCLKHHNECHNSGLIRFSKNYPLVMKWLLDSGWYIEDLFGREKWTHPQYWQRDL